MKPHSIIRDGETQTTIEKGGEMPTEVISAEEARRRLRTTRHLENVTVEGNLTFADRESSKWGWFFSSVLIKGDLTLPRSRLSFLSLRNVTIKGELDLSEAKLERGLVLYNTAIGYALFLWNTKIGCVLELLGLKVQGIVVDSDLARLVHLAAPNTPLIVRFPEWDRD